MGVSDSRSKRQWPIWCARTAGMGVNYNLQDTRHVSPKPSLLRLDSVGEVTSDEDFTFPAHKHSQSAAVLLRKRIPGISSGVKMERLSCKSGLFHNPGGVFTSLSRNYSQSRSGLLDHSSGGHMNTGSYVLPPTMDTSSDMSGLGQGCTYTGGMSMPQKGGHFPWLLRPLGYTMPGFRPPQFRAMQHQPQMHVGPSYFNESMARFGGGCTPPWLNCAGQPLFTNPVQMMGGFRKPPPLHRRGRSPPKPRRNNRSVRTNKTDKQTMQGANVGSIRKCAASANTLADAQNDLATVVEKVQDLSIASETVTELNSGKPGDAGHVPADDCDTDSVDTDVQTFPPHPVTTISQDHVMKAQVYCDIPGVETTPLHENLCNHDSVEPEPGCGHNTASDAMSDQVISHDNVNKLDDLNAKTGSDSETKSCGKTGSDSETKSCANSERTASTFHVRILFPARQVQAPSTADDEVPCAPHEHAAESADNQQPNNAMDDDCTSMAHEKKACRETSPPAARADQQDCKKKKKSRPSSKKRRRRKLQRSDTQCSGTIHFIARDANKPATKRLKTVEIPPTCDAGPNPQSDAETQEDQCNSDAETDATNGAIHHLQIKPLAFVVSTAKSDNDTDTCRLGGKFAFVVHASEITDTSQSESEDSDCDWDDEVDSACSWDSLCAEILPAPLSFQFTCSISSLSPCEPRSPGVTPAVKDANCKWNTSYADTPGKATPEKVHFAPDTTLLTIHREHSWPRDDYALARKGPWEEYARDRQRFHNRIQEVERAIACHVNPSHRDRMYGKLYRSLCS